MTGKEEMKVEEKASTGRIRGLTGMLQVKVQSLCLPQWETDVMYVRI